MPDADPYRRVHTSNWTGPGKSIEAQVAERLRAKRRRQWKWVGVLLAILLVATIWTIVDPSNPKHDSTTGTGSTAGSAYSADDIFLTAVRLAVPAYQSTPDAELISAAHSACNGFERGLSLRDLIAAGVRAGESAHNTGALVGAAVPVYCPEYESRIH